MRSELLLKDGRKAVVSESISSKEGLLYVPLSDSARYDGVKVK